MKSIFTIGGKLAIICAVAAIILGFVNSVTEPKIELNRKLELERALAAVAGDGVVGEETLIEGEDMVYSFFPVNGGSDDQSGYILRLIGLGYGGDMNILANYIQDGEVTKVVLMENQETPGLGKKAEKPEYMNKFIGTGGAAGEVPVRKGQLPQAEADAITGATVTFIGIAKALHAGSEFVKERGSAGSN
jgi:electron transport complex protein RnfG